MRALRTRERFTSSKSGVSIALIKLDLFLLCGSAFGKNDDFPRCSDLVSVALRVGRVDMRLPSFFAWH